MEQLSIFDLFPEESDIESMTTADIAKVIGEAIKVKFKPSGWDDEHEAKVKKLILNIHKSRYSCNAFDDEGKGAAFIGVGYSYGTAGGGSPKDSIEDAIKYFRKIMERAEKGEI